MSDSRMTLQPPLDYEIDASDRISWTSGAWSTIAIMNGVPHLQTPGVLGRSLWDFIEDPTTRLLYEAILLRARKGYPLTFTFRCDSPSERRLLRMVIRGVDEAGVAFDIRQIASQSRPPVPLLDPGVPRSGDTIRMCGWCKRIPLNAGQWVEVEEAMHVLDLLDTPPLPAISHGICPACEQAMTAALGGGQPGEGVIKMGELPAVQHALHQALPGD